MRSLLLATAGLALASLLSPTRAAAADVTDWIPDDAQVVVVFRGADLLAGGLDYLGARFGGVPAVDRVLARMRDWEVPKTGIKPGARQWGAGLAPGRGLAIGLTGPKSFRAILGADDPEAAKARLVELFTAGEVPAKVTPAGLEIDGEVVQCAGRDGFLVCGTQPPPEKAPGTPAWLKSAPVPATSLLVMHARGEALNEITDRQPVFTGAWLALGFSGEAFELLFDAQLAPQGQAVLGLLPASGAAPEAMRLVDRGASFVAKVAFDGPKLLAGLEAMAGGAPPPQVQTLWTALKQHWSGDVVVTDDGGLAHPVLVVGLTSPAGGPALMQAFADTLKAENVPVSVGVGPMRPKLQTLSFTAADTEEGQLVFHLHWATVGSALVVGLVPADVARRVEGKVAPAPLAEPFAQKGVHGATIWAWPSFFTGPWLAEVFSGSPGVTAFIDVNVLVGIVSAVMDETGFTYQPRPDGLQVRAWWRML